MKTEIWTLLLVPTEKRKLISPREKATGSGIWRLTQAARKIFWRSEKQIRHYYERLIDAKALAVKTLDKEQYEFYQSWHYSAVRSLIGIEGFDGDYRRLAARLSPPITAREARAAVGLLLKLGLVQCDDKGHYILTERYISSGEPWRTIAVKTFQRQAIALAGESLDRHRIVRLHFH